MCKHVYKIVFAARVEDFIGWHRPGTIEYVSSEDIARRNLFEACEPCGLRAWYSCAALPAFPQVPRRCPRSQNHQHRANLCSHLAVGESSYVLRCDVMWCDTMWCDVMRCDAMYLKMYFECIGGWITLPGPGIDAITLSLRCATILRISLAHERGHGFD